MKYLYIIFFFHLSFLVQAQADLIPFRKGNLWGFCDKNKKIIVPCQYENVFQFSEGRAMVQLNKKVGFIDETGKIIIPIQYDYLLANHFFKNGLTKVRLESIDGNNRGLIDKYGKIILPLEYFFIGDSFKGLIKIGKLINNKIQFGFCNEKGEILISPIYEKVVDFKENRIVGRKNRKYSLFDVQGKPINDTSYAYLSEFSEGKAVFGVQKQYFDSENQPKMAIKYGFLDSLGNEVIPAIYDMAMPFQENFAVVKENNFSQNTYYLINQQGIMIHKKAYELMDYAVSEGLIWLRKNGKYGFMDTLGQIVIPLEYEYAQTFQQGMALVKKDGKYGFISTDNQAITAFKYDMPSGREIGKFQENLAPVYQKNKNQSGKWGFIDPKGKEIIACKYDDIIPFFNGLARVYIRKGSHWYSGYIDKQGNEYWEE